MREKGHSGIPFALIIPAAGSGSRLGEATPKPFLEVAGKTLLEHAVAPFTEVGGLHQVVVAAPAKWMENARALRKLLPEGVGLEVVEGGAERQDSVRLALEAVSPEAELVAIHDAARPLIRSGMIGRALSAAAARGAALLGVPVQDTLKRCGADGSIQETVERRDLWQAQTPQIFRTALIRRAYEMAWREGFSGTDDASLVERLGEEVVIVTGDSLNFKVTRPADLYLARLLLSRPEPGRGGAEMERREREPEQPGGKPVKPEEETGGDGQDPNRNHGR